MVCNNTYFGGAIVAPDVRNGLQVVVEDGRGALFMEGSHEIRVSDMERVQASQITSIPEATILFGADLPRRLEFARFLQTTAITAQGCLMAGSCALGVAAVVVERAEALIQSHQPD
ncbi:MAG: hypothetical protein AAB558_00670, partial [Patescibacteria group bacterium]